MHIYGNIKNKGKVFNFDIVSDSKKTQDSERIFTFSDKKIFIYIDGTIAKLSGQICELTRHQNSIEEKIAYLYSIRFNFEGHILGFYNIFLFDYTTKELRIIRDSRGTRSVFYSHDEDNFIFSSNQNLIIKSLKKITLNQDKLMEFLNMDLVLTKKTYLNEILRVLPKHYLIYKDNLLQEEKYEFSENLFKVEQDNDVKQDFKRYLFRGVTSFLNQSKKTGIMMSGGLDSSAIAISLKENNYTNVSTYSANFDHIDHKNNIHEENFRKNITELTSYTHTSIQMESKSPLVPIKKFTKILNQPILTPNIYLFEAIAHKLKDDGIETILDGNDGDNTVSHGFEILFYYITNLKLIKFTREVYLYSKFKKTNFIRLVFVLLKQAVKEILNIKDKQNSETMLKKELAIKMSSNGNLSYFSSHERKISHELHFLSNEFRNNFFRYFGIENLSPFYYEELIQFCLNMPLTNKLNEGYTRKILRDFLSDYLPDYHVNRDKSNLASALVKNFSLSDLEIIKQEYKNINQHLLMLIDTHKLENILTILDKGEQINEKDLIKLQVFISANTFLNQNNL
ncbi:MAG: asparagine synthase-related protein [Gammaproteobacteria bacterium]